MKRAAARKEPRQDRARATVDALLEATAQLLVEEGYDGTSTNKIAARAGVSVGSLYQYFDGKEQLVRAVGERHHEQLMAVLALAAADVGDKPLPALIEDIVGAMLQAHAVDPRLHQVLSEQTPATVMLKHVTEDGAAFVRSMFEVHHAKLKKDVDVETAVFILVHAVEGVTHAAVIEHPEMLRGNRLKRELARMITAYVEP